MRATYPVDGGPARRHREHADIFEAVSARRPSEARAAMVHLLETSAEAIRRSTETPRTTPAPAARPKRSPRRP
jgi:DNA-binding FadR family transcriptional regulator